MDPTGLNHIMFAHNIYRCFEEPESPRKKLRADRFHRRGFETPLHEVVLGVILVPQNSAKNVQT